MDTDNQTVGAILALIEDTRSNLNRIEAMLRPGGDEEEDLDPKNPINKNGVNLTPRGVEVAYRMFDVGKTRYAVAQALDISFGAATNRLYAWEKAGGKDRKKQPLKGYEGKYGANADNVRSSVGKVAAAGRWGDVTKIEEERARHYNFMETLPKPPEGNSTDD